MDKGEKDSISMIDVIYIVIRWRWMIVGITALIAIVGVLGFFMKPKNDFTAARRNATVKTRVSFSFSPQVTELVPPSNIETFMKTFFSDPMVVFLAYKNAGFDTFDGYDLRNPEKEEFAIEAIRRILVDNENKAGDKLRESDRAFGYILDSDLRGLFATGNDVEKNKIFLTSLIRAANDALLEYLRPLAARAIESYEILKAERGVSPAESLRSREDLVYAYSIARHLQQENIDVVRIIKGPYALRYDPDLKTFEKTYIRQWLVLTIATCCLSVLLAFFLQYLSDIRNNPDVMEKLKNARHKGKHA